MVEFSCDFATEEPASSTHAHLPGVFLVVGVTPHQVGEGTLMRWLTPAFEESDLVQGLDIR